ncbi:MAG: TonB-dependent receptor [Gammaproteobacteria bacterium]|nr:TonB-dependent receptor [Gammaproteobacteria bacterium]
MQFKRHKLSLLIHSAVLLSAVSTTSLANNNSAASMELPTLEVISVTPLPGIGIPVDKYAGNIQTISAEEIENENALDMAEIMFKNIGSIDINSAQNNPYQNDVNYRGFLASPLVGSAIGLSIYVDGQRVNEGFGDTVNWDLIPDFALGNIVLIPGSNPLFGLNTLGGAISVHTKNGFNFEGSEVELSAGENGRRQGIVQHGGNSGNVDWYVGATKFEEDGWRVNSPSDVKQFFGKVGWESDTTDLDLSYTHIDTDLIGNGFVAESRLASNGWDAIHSYPDQTENKMDNLNLNASHWLNDNTLVAANAFYRNYKRQTLNGDVEIGCSIELNAGGEFEAEDTHLSQCIQGASAAGIKYVDDNGITQTALAADELEVEIEGEERRTETETDTWGGTLQFTHDHQLASMKNQWTIGASYDKAETDFLSIEAEEGDVDLTNGTIIAGTVEEAEVGVDIKTERINYSLMFSDTLHLSDKTALTLAGRYQHSEVKIDNYNPGDEKLEGDHSFSRFNPAFALSHQLQDNVTIYGSYNESFRTPTAAELTCADPEDPCKLPNSFVADPPLDPVIGKTIEIGARGQLASSINWSIAAFRTQLKDDLLFTLANNAGGGYFINVDETQRQGLELGLNGVMDKLAWYSNYSFIDATFESDELLASVVDPKGIQVQSGDEIPAIPRHNIKLGLDYAFTSNFSAGTTMQHTGSSYMRGDEGNDLSKVNGYTLFNLNARYRPHKMVQLWAKVDNVFDREYENSGIRNFNFYNLPADGEVIQEERFVSPGAPRTFWTGVKVSF